MRACPSASRLSSSRLRRSRVGSRIRGRSAFERIDRRVHIGAVDRLHHHMPAMLVEQCDGALRFCGARTGHVTVTPPSFNAGSSGNSSRSLFSSSTSASEMRGRHRDRRVDANPEIAVLADFVEQLQLFLSRADRMHARDAEPVRLADGRAKRGELFGARRLGYQPRHEVDGVVFEDAGRLARAAILDDDPRLGILRLTGDAGKLERFRVGPARRCRLRS